MVREVCPLTPSGFAAVLNPVLNSRFFSPVGPRFGLRFVRVFAGLAVLATVTLPAQQVAVVEKTLPNGFKILLVERMLNDGCKIVESDGVFQLRNRLRRLTNIIKRRTRPGPNSARVAISFD